jgi:alkylated DNA repair dioxygenase AlkB
VPRRARNDPLDDRLHLVAIDLLLKLASLLDDGDLQQADFVLDALEPQVGRNGPWLGCPRRALASLLGSATMTRERAPSPDPVRRWDLADGGALLLHEGWLAPGESARAFERLTAELDWKQRAIRIMGRAMLQPRLTAWYGDAPYTYSGVTLEPLPWTPDLTELRDRIAIATGEQFNTVLCNLYRSGADSMGFHADDEKELGVHPVIASLSLGATRRFVLHHKKKRAAPVSIDLDDGSLLVMGGTTQAFWKHALPKDPATTGARINLTFRRIVPL